MLALIRPSRRPTGASPRGPTRCDPDASAGSSCWSRWPSSRCSSCSATRSSTRRSRSRWDTVLVARGRARDRARVGPRRVASHRRPDRSTSRAERRAGGPRGVRACSVPGQRRHRRRCRTSTRSSMPSSRTLATSSAADVAVLLLERPDRRHRAPRGCRRPRRRRSSMPAAHVRTPLRRTRPTRSCRSLRPARRSSASRPRCGAAARRSGCSRSAPRRRAASTPTRSRRSRRSPTRRPSRWSTIGSRRACASSPWSRNASGSRGSCTTDRAGAGLREHEVACDRRLPPRWACDRGEDAGQPSSARLPGPSTWMSARRSSACAARSSRASA